MEKSFEVYRIFEDETEARWLEIRKSSYRKTPVLEVSICGTGLKSRTIMRVNKEVGAEIATAMLFMVNT